MKDADRLTPTLEAIRALYPSVKHPDVSVPKSGVTNAVGLSLDLSIDQEKQENCLEVLSDMENVLFAIEE